MPQKQRYKINIIPSNSGNLSKRNLPKSRSVDDMDIIIASPGTMSPDGKDSLVKVLPIITPNVLANKHLDMIANRARNVERKQHKMKSRFMPK